MLFGHQNDDSTAAAAAASDGVNPLAVDPATGASLPVAPSEPPAPPRPTDMPEPSVLNQPTAGSAPAFVPDAPVMDVTAPSAVAVPLDSLDAADVSDTDTSQSADGSLPATDTAPSGTIAMAVPMAMADTPAAPDLPAPPLPADTPTLPTADTAAGAMAGMADNTAAPTVPDTPDGDALLALKQQALAQLEPLVDELDQTPEEHFRTTMMLLQSTDNAALIQTAYDAALAITDEKVRAQALLDVINEINYFTQAKPAD